MLTCLVPVLFTFYIQDVLKLKKNSGAKGFMCYVFNTVYRENVIHWYMVPCLLANRYRLSGGVWCFRLQRSWFLWSWSLRILITLINLKILISRTTLIFIITALITRNFAFYGFLLWIWLWTRENACKGRVWNSFWGCLSCWSAWEFYRKWITSAHGLSACLFYVNSRVMQSYAICL